MKQYERIPLPVEAVQVTAENAQEVARWCEADSFGWDDGGNPEINVLTGHGWIYAEIGDWIVKDQDDFRVFINECFWHYYKEIER